MLLLVLRDCSQNTPNQQTTQIELGPMKSPNKTHRHNLDQVFCCNTRVALKAASFNQAAHQVIKFSQEHFSFPAHKMEEFLPAKLFQVVANVQQRLPRQIVDLHQWSVE